MDGGFGLYTWPAATVLAQYIWYNSEKVNGKKVLEVRTYSLLANPKWR